MACLVAFPSSFVWTVCVCVDLALSSVFTLLRPLASGQRLASGLLAYGFFNQFNKDYEEQSLSIGLLLLILLRGLQHWLTVQWEFSLCKWADCFTACVRVHSLPVQASVKSVPQPWSHWEDGMLIKCIKPLDFSVPFWPHFKLPCPQTCWPSCHIIKLIWLARIFYSEGANWEVLLVNQSDWKAIFFFICISQNWLDT